MIELELEPVLHADALQRVLRSAGRIDNYDFVRGGVLDPDVAGHEPSRRLDTIAEICRECTPRRLLL